MPETIEWLVIGPQCLEKVNSLTTTLSERLANMVGDRNGSESDEPAPAAARETAHASISRFVVFR